MKNAAEFLHRIREDPEFREKAESLATDEERMAFLGDAGFAFTPAELEEALKAELPDRDLPRNRETRVLRRSKRYQIHLKVSEVNGQPVTDVVMLDISAWGAKLESLISLAPASTVEFSFTLPGESTSVRLAGAVVWAGQVPASQRYLIGLKFFKSIDQQYREGKL